MEKTGETVRSVNPGVGSVCGLSVERLGGLVSGQGASMQWGFLLQKQVSLQGQGIGD